MDPVSMITAIQAGISTVEKFAPVVEAVGAEIGPLFKEEVADGEVIWGDVQKCWSDFKAAIATAKAAAASSSK